MNDNIQLKPQWHILYKHWQIVYIDSEQYWDMVVGHRCASEWADLGRGNLTLDALVLP